MSTLWVYLDCKDMWMILTRYVWILDGFYYICVRFKWILCSFSWNLNKIWISLVSFFTIWACLDYNDIWTNFNEIWMWNIWRFLLHRLASFSSTNEKPESHRLNQDQVFSLKSRHVRHQRGDAVMVCPRSNCGGLQRDLNLHRSHTNRNLS